MGFYIGFDEAKREREGKMRRKREDKAIDNYKASNSIGREADRKRIRKEIEQDKKKRPGLYRYRNWQ
jgi:hypothetical protein